MSAAEIATRASVHRSSSEILKKLGRSLSFSTSDRSARLTLQSLSDHLGIAIYLDRRIDPGRPLRVEIVEQPIAAGLDNIAAALDASWSLLGPVVYIGPDAHRVATTAAVKRDEVRAMPLELARVWSDRATWKWETLTRPRELLRQLGDQEQIAISNLDRIPHDLWPAIELPETPLVDRLSLVLAGFDLTLDFTAGGRSAVLVPLPEKVSLRRTYPARGLQGGKLLAWQQEFPDVQLQLLGPAGRSSTRLQVTGNFHEHLVLRERLRGGSSRRAAAPANRRELRHSMEVQQQPVGAVLNSIAKQTGLEINIDSGATTSLSELITFTAREATLEDLLDAALDPVNLVYELDGKSLTIRRNQRELQ